MKRTISLLLVCILLFTLCACGGNTLSGKYVNESGDRVAEFKKDGSCTWYQNGRTFVGTYTKMEDYWVMNMNGNGSYVDTVFTVIKEGNYLIIDSPYMAPTNFYKE